MQKSRRAPMSFSRHARLTHECVNNQRQQMPQLTNKNMVVIGGGGGAGRRIVEAGIRDGARVLA
jgi:hypothetical protein